MRMGRPAPLQNPTEQSAKALVRRCLSTAHFDPKPSSFQRAHKSLSLVPLDLGGRPTGAAPFLEIACEVAEFVGRDGYALDQGYRLALSSATGSADFHDAVGGGSRTCGLIGFLLLAATPS